MKRMIFQAEEELLERLRRRARERGVSVAQVVREALERELGSDQPRPRSLGAFHSKDGDLSTRVEELYEPDPWRS